MIELLNESASAWGYTEKLAPVSYQHFLNWIAQKKHEPLGYLADYRKDKRSHISEVFPNVKSALVFLFDYTATKKTLLKKSPKYKLASYTLGFEGRDYHSYLSDKLERIAQQIASDIPKLEYKISLDIHPVLERDLAYRAGLGWFGKNSMLINRKIGSYTMIGSLLLNQKLPLNQQELESDHCGQCTRCMEACPTNAIDVKTRTVESAKCISTYTIELFKDAPAPTGYPTQSGEVFGCDICQEVCPWNAKPMQKVSETNLNEKLVSFFNRETFQILEELSQMSNKTFKDFFKDTSVERVGKKGLIKNLDKLV